MELSFDTADGKVVHAYVPTVPYRGIDLYRALAHELNVDLDDFSILRSYGQQSANSGRRQDVVATLNARAVLPYFETTRTKQRQIFKSTKCN